MGSTPIPFRQLFSLSRRKKKKKPAYDTGAQVRRLARALLGTAPGERVIPSKKKNKAKHKKREQEREAED